MVGLVIVSHSRALAERLVGLLHQVASPMLSIAIAAGVGTMLERQPGNTLTGIRGQAIGS